MFENEMDATKIEPGLVRIDGSTYAVTLYRKFIGIVAKMPAGGYEAMEWDGGSHCFDFKNKKEAVEWVIEMVPNAGVTE